MLLEVSIARGQIDCTDALGKYVDLPKVVEQHSACGNEQSLHDGSFHLLYMFSLLVEAPTLDREKPLL